MFKIRNVLAYIFLVLLLINVTNSATLYVNASGNCGPYSNGSTIQEGIDAASTGDTVIICKNGSSGYTYNNNINVDLSINLQGNESSVTVHYPPVLSLAVFNVGAAYANISNFTIIGNLSQNAINLNSSASNVKLSYLNIYNTSRAVNILFSNNHTIVNNNFSDNVNVSFFVGSNFTTLANNTFSGSFNNSFFISSSNNNTFTQNNLSDNLGYGAYLSSGNGNVFSFNNFSNDTQGGFILSDSHWNTIISNNLSLNGANGLQLLNSHNNTIQSNYMQDNVVTGLWLSDSRANNISSNIIGDVQQAGIYLSGVSSDNNIFSNTIENHTTGVASGIFLQSVVSQNNIYDNNQLNNNTIGIYLNYSNSTNITNNTITNSQVAIYMDNAYQSYITDQDFSGTVYGYNLSGSSENFIINATIHSNTQAGIYLDSTSENNLITGNTIYNHTQGLASGIYVNGTTSLNNITANPNISNNSFGIFAINANATFITNNTFNNNYIAIHVYNSSNHNIGSNTVENSISSSGGILLNSSNLNILSYNAVRDSQGVGIYLLTSHNNTLNGDSSANDMYQGAVGIYVFNSDSNNLTNVSTFNNTHHGLYVTGSSDNNLINFSTAYNNSRAGFAIAGTSATSNTFKDNTAYNHPTANAYSAFYFDTAINSTNVTNNTAYDNYRGFLFASSNITLFTQNNITNATYSAIQLASGTSNVNFSGNNGVYSMNSGSNYVEIDSSGDSQFSTNNFNITTDNLNFQVVNSTDVRINVTNLSTFNTITTITGYSLDSSQVVQSQQGNYFAVGIRNLSANGSASIKLFYNSSDNSSTNLGIGSTSSVGTWTYHNSTINTSEKSLVPQTSITSFSLFVPIGFNESTSTTISSSGDDESDPIKSMDVSYSFDSSTGLLTITILDSKPKDELEDASLVLIPTSFGGSSMSGNTNSDGQDTFIITKSGTYKLISSKNGYFQDTINMDLILSDGSPSTPVNDSLSLTYSFDPSTGLLTVTVTDQNGNLVPDATVSINGPDSMQEQTDSNGQAHFTINDSGTYMLDAAKEGYSPDSDSVDLNSAQQGSLSISYTFDSSTGLLTIIVTDQDGNTVSGALVSLGGSLQGLTNSEGQIEFTITDSGIYALDATKQGYEPDSDVVELNLEEDDGEGLLDAITELQDDITQADLEGYDITNSQNSLDSAKISYDEGNFDQTRIYLDESRSLLDSAEMKDQQVESDLLFNYWWACLILLILLIIFFLLFWKKRKKKKRRREEE